MENGEALAGKNIIMVSHAFSFLSSRWTEYNNSTVAFCAFVLHHKRFFEHAIPSTTSRKCVWLFSQPSTRTYTENVALDFSLCSLLRFIIYALSEPQMGLGKSRRKNLRPSFQKLFPSFNTIFFLMMLIRKWKCLLGSNFVPNYFFTLFCCTFNGKSLEKKCLKSYLFMNLKLVFVVKMCFI